VSPRPAIGIASDLGRSLNREVKSLLPATHCNHSKKKKRKTEIPTMLHWAWSSKKSRERHHNLCLPKAPHRSSGTSSLPLLGLWCWLLEKGAMGKLETSTTITRASGQGQSLIPSCR